MSNIWGEKVFINRYQARNYFWMAANTFRKAAFDDLWNTVLPSFKPLKYFLEIDDYDIPYENYIDSLEINKMLGISPEEMPLCFFTNKQLGVLLEEHGKVNSAHELEEFGNKLLSWLNRWHLKERWCAEMALVSLKNYPTKDRFRIVKKDASTKTNIDIFTKNRLMLKYMPNNAIALEYLNSGVSNGTSTPYIRIEDESVASIIPPEEMCMDFRPLDGWNYHLGETWPEAKERLLEKYIKYLKEYKKKIKEESNNWRWCEIKTFEILVRNIMPISKTLDSESLEILAPSKNDIDETVSRKAVSKKTKGLREFLGIRSHGAKPGPKKYI